VIGRLQTAAVEVVIDVRAVAASRRPGFSKTMLAASLLEAGIDYVHFRSLGTPKAGRDAARAGRIAEMQRIYAGHLAEPAAQMGLAAAIGRKAALLCFEADAARCHRAMIASLIRDETGREIVDL
jgi:uncharacterized protein (DUF488 family)